MGEAAIVVGLACCGGASLALAAGVRRHRPADARPWLLALAGQLVLTTVLVGHLLPGVDQPSAVIAIAFSFAAVAGAGAGLLFVRRVLRPSHREDVLDEAVVAAALALVLLGGSAGREAGEDLLWTVVPVAMTVALATALRLLVAIGPRSPAAWLLVGYGLLGTAAGLWQPAGGSGIGAGVLFLAASLCLGLAALPRSMRRLTEPAPRPSVHPFARLAVLGVALLVTLGVLLGRTGAAPGTALPALAAATLTLWLLTRLGRLLSDRERARRALDARAEQLDVVAAQQAAAARLGQRALELGELDDLYTEAVALVATTLRVELCGLFALSSDRAALVLRTGLGWGEGAAGTVVLPATANLPAALLEDDEPPDADGPGPSSLPALDERGVVDTAAVAVGDRRDRFGLLTVHTRTRRSFGPGDLDFLRAVGSVLAGATARVRAEDRIRHQAFHDPLTGLANRTLFRDRIDHALLTHRRSGRSVALLYVDLDDFKTVNDSLGHAAGDQVLIAVADRIRSCLRPGDTAARLGGDEFALLLEDLDGTAAAVGVADRLLAVLTEPVPAVSRYVRMSASIGIAIGGGRAGDADAGRGTTGEALLREADAAMYTAKSSGKDAHRVFEAPMHARALRRLELKSDLDGALLRGEFAVVYQPIVDLRTGAAVGAEALLRWHHPVLGSIAPLEFLPLAEQTGVIVPIGGWVLDAACRQARAWADHLPSPSRLSVSVNVSARQLAHPGMAAAVAATLSDAGLPASALVLDLTESVLLAEEHVAALAELRALGVRLALDDFGTGWSSLDRLRRVRPDVIKIDGRFVADLDGADADVARGVLHLAAALGITTLAEGVETATQFDVLRTVPCDLAQGWLFARPLDPLAFGELVATGRVLTPAGPRSAHLR